MNEEIGLKQEIDGYRQNSADDEQKFLACSYLDVTKLWPEAIIKMYSVLSSGTDCHLALELLRFWLKLETGSTKLTVWVLFFILVLVNATQRGTILLTIHELKKKTTAQMCCIYTF